MIDMTLSQRAHDAFFNKLHNGNLIYNTCWEDPRLDRMMLDLQSDSSVVMITSAGCNALDYLLAGPAAIHAVDMNPRQNALLQLKVSLIERGDFQELFTVFGQGFHPHFRSLLKCLQNSLHPFAYQYWMEKAEYFQCTLLAPSFYYRGTTGRMAWIALHSFLGYSKKIRHYVSALLEAKSLAEQIELYEKIKPTLWNRFISWLVRQPMVMTMLGVPRAQIRLIESSFPGGLTGYIQDKLEHVLTRIPFQDNYFWRVYITGRYTRESCPRYLQEHNLPQLRERTSRIYTHSTTISNFLRENPGQYSHFILLDHQDWLAAHNQSALEEEWRLILENSRPGTRILMRSASPVIDFIPAFAKNRLKTNPLISDTLHLNDRVGTYGCTLLADITA